MCYREHREAEKTRTSSCTTQRLTLSELQLKVLCSQGRSHTSTPFLENRTKQERHTPFAQNHQC